MRYLLIPVTISLIAISALASACSVGGGGAKATSTPDVAALVQQGLDAHRAGDVVKAASIYQAVLAADPQNKYAHFNLGVIDQAAGRNDQAENRYRLALTTDPEFPEPMFNLAILRTAAGYPLDAIGLYRHVITIQPDNAGAHLNLSILLRQVSLEDEANAELQRALDLNPAVAATEATTVAGRTPGAATPQSTRTPVR